MSSSQQHWFVQTDFGALLGPMPDDALAEMARTGALLIRDRVREGTDGEWRPAGEVPGLFDEATPQLGLMSSQLEDLFAPQATPTREPAADRRIHRHPESMREDRSPVLLSPEFEFEIDTPLITPPAASPAPIVNQVDLNFDFDVPLMIPAPVVTPPKVIPPALIVSRDVSLPTFSPSPVVADPREPPRLNPPAPVLESRTINEMEPVHSTPTGWQTRPSSATRWRPATKSGIRWSNLDRQTWLIGAIAAGVFVAFVALWWLWPRQRPDLYASYVAIYKELQERKDGAPDQAGWSDFTSRARSQLDATIPWLEERAKPGNREKSLLLYVGRDLQNLLDRPRIATNPHQERLAVFFDQLQEIYGSK